MYDTFLGINHTMQIYKKYNSCKLIKLKLMICNFFYVCNSNIFYNLYRVNLRNLIQIL